MRRIGLYILASPLVLILIAFDIAKIPVLILFSPVWLLLDAISVLKGDKSMYLEFIIDSATIGWQVSKMLLDADERF